MSGKPCKARLGSGPARGGEIRAVLIQNCADFLFFKGSMRVFLSNYIKEKLTAGGALELEFN